MKLWIQTKLWMIVVSIILRFSMFSYYPLKVYAADNPVQEDVQIRPTRIMNTETASTQPEGTLIVMGVGGNQGRLDYGLIHNLEVRLDFGYNSTIETSNTN